jgi:DNA polymerase-3 subunit delta'
MIHRGVYMGDWRVIGHEWAVDFLMAGLRHGRTRHAYLITGSQNIGKHTLVRSFAAALNCTHEAAEQRPCWQCRSCKWVVSGNHPDLIYAVNDEITGAIRIEAVREVIQQLALRPFIARYRVAIFDEFDRAAPRTQDALLKTIEEPSPHAVILLMAQRSEHILPTIRSRCQALPLRPAPTERVRQLLVGRGAPDEQAMLLARLSSGRVGWALQALENPDVLEDRDNILNLLSEAVRGSRLKRFNIAEMISAQASKDRDALRYLLEMWQTYWRDVVLHAYGALVKPCNTDRLVEIQQWAQRIPREAALQALQATRRTLYVTLETNASVRLALEALMLAYPRY